MKINEIIEKFYAFIPFKWLNINYDLCQIYNLVENELAHKYFPLYHEEEFNTPKVEFKDFTYQVIRVIEHDDNCKISFNHNCIYTYDGTNISRVKYSYLPIYKNIEDDSSYSEKYLLIIIYGMLSEYYILEGEFENAYIWSNRYKQCIADMYVKIGEKKNVSQIFLCK